MRHSVHDVGAYNREDEHKGDAGERERNRMCGRVVEMDFAVKRDRSRV